MLTLPNYDDQRFEDIMEMVKRRIPVLYPQWTDMNEHDPGITILELFAWLKEMQQYHLNRITTQGYENMLALLGAVVSESSAALTWIVLPNISQGSLPQGMRFEAPGEIIFECQDTVKLNTFRIQSIYVNDGTGFQDVQDIIREPKLYCHPFGQNPMEGESSLYLGVDRLEQNREFSLFLQFDDSYPVLRNPFKDNSRRPRNVVWEYGAAAENGLEFKPVELSFDRTYGFSQSEEIRFRIGEDADPVSLGEGIPECCWLRARMLRKGCEENPRLMNIHKDPIPVSQKRTICDTISFTLLENKEDAVLKLRTWLALKGRQTVFVRDSSGWQIHNDLLTHIQREGNAEIAVLKLINLPQDLLMDGTENIRVLCYETDFGESLVLSGSNGLPGQRFPLEFQDTILREQLSVMVYEETEQELKRWTDWKYISKLSQAGPYDRSFTYDRANQEIVFGDNEQGAVPQAGDHNIVVTRCVTSKGSMGNIACGSFEVLEYGDIRCMPYNPVPASGGGDAENIGDAIERVKASLKQVGKAVTVADYEELAAATPGLRIMGVKAIPFYDPDSRVSGEKQAPATVTVVVLPYSEDPFPMPDEQFLVAVGKHLEDYRLITTNVKVIGPVYIKISVYIEVVLENNRWETNETVIKAAIASYFETVRKGIPEGKPGFGQPIRESIIAMKIEAVPGVVHVKKVTLGVRYNESYKDKYGNITIPPHGLPYLGDLQIRTLS
ncbi:MAG: hypothetical protein APF81_15360 [Desulfosporosinus sp. BRH_c37]|nr:MAG: hypothetical protein APF81_15360 [Desulfosporosinus sp. BRH_c37]